MFAANRGLLPPLPESSCGGLLLAAATAWVGATAVRGRPVAERLGGVVGAAVFLSTVFAGLHRDDPPGEVLVTALTAAGLALGTAWVALTVLDALGSGTTAGTRVARSRVSKWAAHRSARRSAQQADEDRRRQEVREREEADRQRQADEALAAHLMAVRESFIAAEPKVRWCQRDSIFFPEHVPVCPHCRRADQVVLLRDDTLTDERGERPANIDPGMRR